MRNYKLHLHYALILSVIMAFVIFLDWFSYIHEPVVTQDVIYQLKPGTTLRQLSHQLKSKAGVTQSEYFVLLAKLYRGGRNLKAGEYALKKGMTPHEILTLLHSGKVIQHELTLIEGWTNKDIFKALKENSNIEHTIKYADDIKDALGLKQSTEGLFYPDTYKFPKSTSDVKFLQRAHQILQAKLNQAWQKRQPMLPYQSAYQALIVASLIEKETALTSEKPVVASVILKRLKKNMPLQIDPTVIYALGDKYTGKILKQDLSVKSPYNTYQVRGLPPTPIAIVSMSSLTAALHPADTAYLYFVAKGDGSHVFSETLDEQRLAIKRYIKTRKKTKDS